jgi:hypothetical protein
MKAAQLRLVAVLPAEGRAHAQQTDTANVMQAMHCTRSQLGIDPECSASGGHTEVLRSRRCQGLAKQCMRFVKQETHRYGRICAELSLSALLGSVHAILKQLEPR